MDIKGWHRAFKVQLDSLDTESALRLQPEVIDVFLNKAINKVMIDLYDSYEESQEMSDALSSQTLIKDLTFEPGSRKNQWKITLPNDYYHHLQSYAKIGYNFTEEEIYKDVITTTTTRVPLIDPATGEQAFEIDRGTGAIILLWTTQTVTTTTRVLDYIKYTPQIEGEVRTVKQLLDNENKVISSPFEKADDTEIPLFFKDGKIYTYVPDNARPTYFSITYLKNPIIVSYKGNNGAGISSDIDEYLHERIINLAVIYALETYGSERTAAKVQIKDVT